MPQFGALKVFFKGSCNQLHLLKHMCINLSAILLTVGFLTASITQKGYPETNRKGQDTLTV